MPEHAEKTPFPPWLRELCYFCGLVVSLAVFALGLKSDQRSASEKLDRLSADLAAFSTRLSGIEQRLPNKEAEDIKFKTLEDKVNRDRNDLDFEIAKLVKWKEDTDRLLIKKGIE